MAIKNFQDETVQPEHDQFTPHRDTHYLLALVTRGEARLNLDFEELTVNAPALLIVFPGQVHYFLEQQDLRGWAISFDPTLMDPDLEPVLSRGSMGPLPLQSATLFHDQLTALMQLLEGLMGNAADAYTSRTASALLKALLSLIAGQLNTTSADVPAKVRRAVQIEQDFRQLLEQHFVDWKQPAQYADQLAITVSHLNDTVKAVTGSSVSTHIQQRAMLEAKRLLYFTQHSAREIGYELGYDEPVYFGKLFKKVTGLTPLQFRQQFRQ